MNQRKATLSLLLLLQILITVVYGAMLVNMTQLLFEAHPDSFIDEAISYLPQFVILVSSLIPQIVLRAKRKLHSQDGEVFPLLFTMIALQVTLVIPMFTEVTGIFILDRSILVTVGRFSLLGTAVLFLISALRYYGFNSSKISFYIFVAMISSLFLSVIAPISSLQQDNAMNIFNSRYDIYIQLVIILFYLATILTLFVYALKDKSPVNTKRLLGFTFLIIGLHLSISYEFLTSIISSVLYLLGIIILTFNPRESF